MMRFLSWSWSAVALVAGATGCSDAIESEPRPQGGSGGTSAGSTSAAGSTSVAGSTSAAGTVGTTAGSGGASAGSTSVAGTAGASGGGLPGAGGSSLLEAPDNEAELVAFLAAKQYAGWAKEAAYHASVGPHGDAVKVFYSPKAAAALKSGAPTFPAGAAAVKELTSGGSVYGHAVWVKVQDATDAGNGFYWYEVIHQGGGVDNVYGNALGSGDCVGCHVTGKDYDLSTEPFN